MKASTIYFWCMNMTTTLMQLSFSQCQIWRYLLLSPPSNPSDFVRIYKSIDYQFVPSNEHRVNAAERAIQYFKNHFISALYSKDPKLSIKPWDQLLPQAEDSLYMLHITRDDPTKSSYEILHDKNNFNAHPWAPPDCKVIVHEHPQTCT
ncbi:hypothetical protein ACHAXS_005844 [Conticribra weissflogii]